MPLYIFALPNETVVQWISHSPCGRRFDPGTLQKHLLKPISGSAFGCSRDNKTLKKTTSKYWSRPEKKKNVTSVVQWLSHQGSQVRSRASPNTTTKINLLVEPSGAPGTTNPQKQPPILLVSPRKKTLYHAFIIILMLNVNHDSCLNDPVSCSALLSRIMTRRLHCSTSNC